MNSLYKRFVTMSMISVSSILAWIYCLFEFKNKPVYIAIISLVLVASVYALFVAAYQIKLSKDAAMQQYINDTLNRFLQESNKNDTLELERITKALYVQLRKSNSVLYQISQDNKDISKNTETLISEATDKIAKLSSEAAQSNTDRLIDAGSKNISELSKAYEELAEALKKLNTELIYGRNTSNNITPNAPAVEEIDAPASNEPESTDDSLDIFNSANITDDFFSQFGGVTDTVNYTPQDNNADADVIPFPVSDVAPSDYDDDDDDEIVDIRSTSDISPANNDDPNRTMSPDEIAALFASAGNEPAPIEADPNKTLSPDEIAALFAAMQ